MALKSKLLALGKTSQCRNAFNAAATDPTINKSLQVDFAASARRNSKPAALHIANDTTAEVMLMDASNIIGQVISNSG
jgi:hypothetical protein